MSAIGLCPHLPVNAQGYRSADWLQVSAWFSDYSGFDQLLHGRKVWFLNSLDRRAGKKCSGLSDVLLDRLYFRPKETQKWYRLLGEHIEIGPQLSTDRLRSDDGGYGSRRGRTDQPVGLRVLLQKFRDLLSDGLPGVVTGHFLQYRQPKAISLCDVARAPDHVLRIILLKRWGEERQSVSPRLQ